MNYIANGETTDVDNENSYWERKDNTENRFGVKSETFQYKISFHEMMQPNFRTLFKCHYSSEMESNFESVNRAFSEERKNA